jgi:glycosyltransferase involved in cell wall biosynthesis
VRLGVYTDYVYHRIDGVLHAERAFALFLAALAPHFDRVVLIGRLAPDAGEARYPLPAELELVPVPHYVTLADPVAALRSLSGSLRTMWHALDQLDLLWVLGPYPHAIALALLGRVRGRSVVLGVRQDWPSYVRMRHPHSRRMHKAADLMEWMWRSLARRLPAVAVGPELRQRYGHAPAVLELSVSLVPGAAVLQSVPPRDYGGELRVLSVGRLDEEKNPLLLADVLAALRRRDPRWRLLVAGEGPLAPELARRLEALGVGDHAELLGYVPMGPDLLGLYRTSHVLLHVSWTEGFPQVLIEAFASGLPVVATAVGGVAEGVGTAAVLIEPGDSTAATRALERIAEDAPLREQVTAEGLRRAAGLTLEAQVDRLASFLRESASVPRRERAAS